MRQQELDKQLFRAAQKGEIDTLAAAIVDGANIAAVDHNGHAALSMAVMSGHVHCVEYLLSKKADVNATSIDGWTPLHLSIIHDHLDCVIALVENNADIHATCTRTFQEFDQYNQNFIAHVDGFTPLHLAVENYNFKIVEYLISRGADLSLRNEDGETARDIAEKYNITDMAEFIDSLLEQSNLDKHIKCNTSHAEEMHF